MSNIRVGRYITLEMDAADEKALETQVDAMCRQLLANPIIEDYRFEITKAGEGA